MQFLTQSSYAIFEINTHRISFVLFKRCVLSACDLNMLQTELIYLLNPN